MFGLSFYCFNFFILRKASLGAVTFLFFILLAAAIKLILIIMLTYIISLSFAEMNWLAYILGLILAIKTIPILLLQRN